METAPTKIHHSAACNQLSSCSIFDYESISKRCRLFQDDSTTGAIISSALELLSTLSLIINRVNYIKSIAMKFFQQIQSSVNVQIISSGMDQIVMNIFQHACNYLHFPAGNIQPLLISFSSIRNGIV